MEGRMDPRHDPVSEGKLGFPSRSSLQTRFDQIATLDGACIFQYTYFRKISLSRCLISRALFPGPFLLQLLETADRDGQ